MVAGIVVSFYWPVVVLGWSSCRFGVSLHHGTSQPSAQGISAHEFCVIRIMHPLSVNN